MKSALAFALSLATGVLLTPPASAAEPALFQDEIRPIITSKCLNCHGADKKKGGLDLTRRSLAVAGGDSGPALTPGKAADSLLYRKLAAGEMPPANPLSAEQVAAFKTWIDAGAPYRDEPLAAASRRAGADWWSLQPVRRPLPPQVTDASWIRTPVDAFVLAKLHEHGLRPAPEVCRATLIRRATFDLHGLPPTPEETSAFINDPSADAYEKLIDRLLVSPRYGERWGRHWLDVVRFAESHGYETNLLRFNAWPYRDYVIRAFNEDIPYPQFIREQLAADALPGSDWLAKSATGFLVGGAHDVVGNQTVEGMLQQRQDDLDDIITAVGATFLGLTVNCCRCHDHKFDPLPQKDYYALQAIFAGVQHAEREIPPPDAERRKQEVVQLRSELEGIERRLDDLEPLAIANDKSPRRLPVNAKRNLDRFEPAEARFVRFTVTATNSLEPCLDELEIFTAGPEPRNVALTSAGAKTTASSTLPNSSIHKLEHLNDGRYGNSRSWISNEFGKGWVQIELAKPCRVDRVVWGRDREEKFKDRLPTAYQIEVALEPGQWQVVASSADRMPFQSATKAASVPADQRERVELARRRSQIEERVAELQASNKVYAGTFTQPGPTHLLTRGDPMRKAEAVAPAAPSAVRPPLTLAVDSPEQDRRMALARWLGHPDNPLTARVLVNRVWHYHFGQGLVTTPSDFGMNGGRPSHPELLDWLADEFMRTGWRLKPLHRTLMLSATYRQSAQSDAKALAVDRQNRLLWRTTPHRLEAEAIRDTILAVSGNLDLRAGGPGYNLWEKNTNYVVVFNPKTELGPDEFRRMVYQFKPRSQQDPTFGIFDCPDAALARPKRNVSTTALQALNLLNGHFTLKQAELFAERLRREAGEATGKQAERAFRLAFGRRPSAGERDRAAALIRAHGLPAFCRAVYNANEFVYVE